MKGDESKGENKLGKFRERQGKDHMLYLNYNLKKGMADSSTLVRQL